MRVCPKCNIPYPNSVERCVRDQSPLSALQDFIEENAPLIRGNVIGEVVGNYKLHKKLGAGAMGTVYQGSHISIGKEVAVKILREDCAHNEQILERFFQEARSLAKLNHENIVQVLDFGCTNEGMAFLVTELLIGQSLDSLLTKEKIFSPAKAIPMIVQICRGLEAAHKLKIIHRDLKPDNVHLIQFADSAEFVKLLDFGIAKQLDSNTVAGMTKAFIGTPAYMPPEQAHEIDERSDLYSLGVILYRMLTGAVPFDGTNMVDVLYKHLTEPPKPMRQIDPGIPEALDEIVLRCLAKQKTQRFSSALELANALRAVDLQSTSVMPVQEQDYEDSPTEFDRTGPTSAHPILPDDEKAQEVIFHTTHSGGSGELTFKKKKKNRAAVFGAVGVLASIGVLAGVILFSGDGAPQEPGPSAAQPTETTTQPSAMAEPATTPASQEIAATQEAPTSQEAPKEVVAVSNPPTNEKPKNTAVIKKTNKTVGNKIDEKKPKDDPFGKKPNGGLE